MLLLLLGGTDFRSSVTYCFICGVNANAGFLLPSLAVAYLNCLNDRAPAVSPLILSFGNALIDVDDVPFGVLFDLER